MGHAELRMAPWVSPAVYAPGTTICHGKRGCFLSPFTKKSFQMISLRETTQGNLYNTVPSTINAYRLWKKCVIAEQSCVISCESPSYIAVVILDWKTLLSKWGKTVWKSQPIGLQIGRVDEIWRVLMNGREGWLWWNELPFCGLTMKLTLLISSVILNLQIGRLKIQPVKA